MTSLTRRISSFAAVVRLLAGCAVAEEVSVRSGPAQTQLLELFTSEGCSSCPPAERWLSTLAESPRLWKDLVPMSFHVDYWDGLGWKDFLASSAYTARQRSYAASWPGGNVYTPAFVLNGREWKRLGLEGIPTPAAPTGVLQATLGEQGDVTVTFVPSAKRGGPFTASAALLGSGLKSEVKAGENSGRTLQHDFAVFALKSGEMVSQGGGEFRAKLRLPPGRVAKSQSAFAVWITEGRSLESIQAAGGPL